MQKKICLLILFFLLVCVSNQIALAMSVLCDYTYTGSNGDYLLNFHLTNNIPAEYKQHIGGFAIDLPYDGLAGTPISPYWVQAPEGYIVNNGSAGGSNINYPISWVGAGGYNLTTGIITPNNDIQPGDTLSGFTVHVGQIPNTIHFAAFASDVLYYTDEGNVFYGGPGYYEDDAFLKGHFVGFEGIVGKPVVTPEPCSVALFGLGLGAVLLRSKEMLRIK